MKSKQAILAGIALWLAVGGAFAHGDESHPKKAGKHADSHASAGGQAGDPKKVTRTVPIEMNDTMRFVPASVPAKRGETIRFVVRNTGKVKHEMVLGTIGELKEHAALMRKFPEMEHADPNQVSVEPGNSAELVWQFTRDGTFEFACLQSGHFEAGMVGKILVRR